MWAKEIRRIQGEKERKGTGIMLPPLSSGLGLKPLRDDGLVEITEVLGSVRSPPHNTMIEGFGSPPSSRNPNPQRIPPPKDPRRGQQQGARATSKNPRPHAELHG